MSLYEGKKILITGAHIDLSEELAKRGSDVIITRRKDKLDALAQKIDFEDLSMQSGKKLYDKLNVIDILINNAATVVGVI